MKQLIKCIFLIQMFIVPAFCKHASGQVKEVNDTFFLLRKKGLLKKLGKSIYRETEPNEPVKALNLFLPFKGKTIRSVTIAPTGFNRIINDTLGVKKSFTAGLADYFHKNTLPQVIRKNLFFKEGDKILPLLFADNEYFLRELPFIQDAVIVVQIDSLSPDAADVIIVTRDVFSIGGSVKVNNKERAGVSLREENLLGTGNGIGFSALMDRKRTPFLGAGASFTLRNAGRSFINLSGGVKTFDPAFNSGRPEETNFFFAVDKPLFSRYSFWTGAAAFSYNVTENAYSPDSVYSMDFKYRTLRTDIWGGINIGYKNRKERDSEKRLRHFVAARSFYNVFYTVPDRYKSVYNFSYADINGLLASYSLYKQNFYRTNFIYGFGRNEDVPEGINATVITGYTNKQGVRRPYYGLEFDATHYSKKGFYTSYTLRSGSFVNKKYLQDGDILVGISHFTKLHKLSSNWRTRNFFSANFSRQFNTVLNPPLYLQSIYGLPYFRNNIDAADTRTTVKFESVYYNLKKFLGFRFAPFVFSDVSFLQPVHQPANQTRGYTAIGGGLRTRNENFVFGTIEVKGYLFPRVYPGMPSRRIEFSTNIRFKYNSSFIRRPDFISSN